MSRSQHKHIALDYDGTASHYEKWTGQLGEPVAAMTERVMRALARGWKVTVFTARVEALFDPAATNAEREDAEQQRKLIQMWTRLHYGKELDVTAVKLRSFSEFWDDRAVRVAKNTGGFDAGVGECWGIIDADIYSEDR